MPRDVDPRTLVLVIMGLVGLKAKFPAAAAVTTAAARIEDINRYIATDGFYNAEG